jgi:hypothetical protein
MEKVLYYPYINLPDNKWTIRTILYWDKVGSIIPESYGKQENFSPFTYNLLNQGLIERVNPHEIWNVSNYEESLIEAITKGDMFIEKSRMNFLAGDFVKIHFEKFHYRVFEKIIELGIAQKVNPTEWYIVESNAAKLMMTFLATILSIEKGYQPTTDTKSNLDIAFNKVESDKYLSKFHKAHDLITANVRGEVLENIMPYPMELDLNKVSRFKERHNDELRYFRKHIEKIVFSASLIADNSKREIAIKRELSEINEQKESLLRKMKEFNFNKIFFGGACGLFATATPMVADPSLIGLPALLYGLYAVYKDTQKRKIDDPIHYLALTEKKFMR